MSETPQEYQEPTSPDPEQEIERPATPDAGDGELNPGTEPTPEEIDRATHVHED